MAREDLQVILDSGEIVTIQLGALAAGNAVMTKDQIIAMLASGTITDIFLGDVTDPDNKVQTYNEVDAMITAALGGSTGVAYNFSKVIGHVVTDDVYEDVIELILTDQPIGIYEYALAWQWDIDSINTSAYLRFSISDGASWDEMVSEAKDVNDKYYRYYAFPIEEQSVGTRQLKVQARKENAGDIYNINFIDAIIKRVG